MQNNQLPTKSHVELDDNFHKKQLFFVKTYKMSYLMKRLESKPGTPGGPNGSNLAPGGTPLQETQ